MNLKFSNMYNLKSFFEKALAIGHARSRDNCKQLQSKVQSIKTMLKKAFKAKKRKNLTEKAPESIVDVGLIPAHFGSTGECPPCEEGLQLQEAKVISTISCGTQTCTAADSLAAPEPAERKCTCQDQRVQRSILKRALPKKHVCFGGTTEVTIQPSYEGLDLESVLKGDHRFERVVELDDDYTIQVYCLKNALFVDSVKQPPALFFQVLVVDEEGDMIVPPLGNPQVLQAILPLAEDGDISDDLRNCSELEEGGAYFSAAACCLLAAIAQQAGVLLDAISHAARSLGVEQLKSALFRNALDVAFTCDSSATYTVHGTVGEGSCFPDARNETSGSPQPDPGSGWSYGPAPFAAVHEKWEQEALY